MHWNWFNRSILRDDDIIIGGTGDTPPVTEEIIGEIEDTADEVDDISEQIAALESIGETRHAELIQRLDSCQTRMTELSSTTTGAETPLLTQVLAEIATMRGELTSLRASVDSMSNRPIPSESLLTESPLNADVDDQREVETVEIPSAETPPENRARKFRVI